MALISLKNYQINVDMTEGLFPHDVVFVHGNLASNTWWSPALEFWQARAFRGALEPQGSRGALEPQGSRGALEPQGSRGALEPGGSTGNKAHVQNGRAIFVEWRGCGKSTGPQSAPKRNSDLAPEQLAEDLIELVGILNLHKFGLVGHSFGGLISLMAALRAPELISKLVLLDSVGATGVQFPKEGRDAFLQMRDDRAFCATVMAGTIHNCNVQTALFDQIVNETMAVDPLLWTAIPEVLQDIDIVDALIDLVVPTLIIHGELDPVIPKADSVLLAAELPHSKYLELAQHGHSPNLESPELFASIVHEFLFADA